MAGGGAARGAGAARDSDARGGGRPGVRWGGGGDCTHAAARAAGGTRAGGGGGHGETHELAIQRGGGGQARERGVGARAAH
eukprot:1915999-Pleurochrysis_carterae.AAC.1